MDFPQESIDWARNGVLAKYYRRTHSKPEIAASIYDGNFIKIEYGFSEAIKKGNCGLYPHEIDRECDCFTKVGADYLVAREAGLKPRIWDCRGIKDVRDGQKLENRGSYDHSFVTVETKKGETTIIDNQLSLYGKVKFHKGKHVIEVYERHNQAVTFRHYASLTQVSEQEFLRRLNDNRTPQGGMRVLETTQRLKARGGLRVFLGYNFETHELKSSLRFEKPLLFPESASRKEISELVTEVEETGDYDFRNGNFCFYNAFMDGWAEHERPQVPLIVSVKDAEKVWEVWEAVLKETGRKSGPSGMNYLALEEQLRTAGFSDDFSVSPRSKASKAIRLGQLGGNLDDFRQAEGRIIASYLQRVKKHSLSHKELLRLARYVRESDAARSRDNPRGLIYSEQNYEELVRRLFEFYKIVSEKVYATGLEVAKINAGLRRGTKYTADRMWSKRFERAKEQVTYFDTACRLRNSKFPFIFPRAADWELFRKNYNLGRLSVRTLSEGIKETDLKRAAQSRLFMRLASALTFKDTLLVASYKPGLRKILNRTK